MQKSLPGLGQAAAAVSSGRAWEQFLYICSLYLYAFEPNPARILVENITPTEFLCVDQVPESIPHPSKQIFARHACFDEGMASSASWDGNGWQGR